LGFETLKYNAVAAKMSRGKSEKNSGLPWAVLPPWPNSPWMCVCIWVRIWFHHFTSASYHRFQHYTSQNGCFDWFVECNKIQALPYEITLIK
jgi:argininosuccinate lyase